MVLREEEGRRGGDCTAKELGCNATTNLGIVNAANATTIATIIRSTFEFCIVNNINDITLIGVIILAFD
jgi:hypothetical protein